MRKGRKGQQEKGGKGGLYRTIITGRINIEIW